MKHLIIKSLILVSFFSLNSFAQEQEVESELCPDPSIEKYKSVQKEFDAAAIDDALRAGARIVVVIPGVIRKNFDLEGFNGEVWQEIKGGYECMKDTLTGGAEWYNTVQTLTFCPVATSVGVASDISETVVKSVAQVPHVVGDIANLGESLTQKGLEKTIALTKYKDSQVVFAGILGTIPMGIFDIAFKAVGEVSHFLGNVVDTIINYNVAGAAKSAVRIGQGFYLLNPETIIDNSKELGCRVGTVPQKIIYSIEGISR